MTGTTSYANSVFEQPWWLEAVSPGKWHEVFVEDKGQIIARLPYVLSGRKVYMPPLTQTLGPWIKDKSFERGNTQLSKQKEIINQLVQQLPRVKSFRMRLNAVNTYVLPYYWLGYRLVPLFSYRINDLTNLETVYDSLGRTVHKNIKSASKKVIISTIPNISIINDLNSKTYMAQKRKNLVDSDLVERVVDASITHNAGHMIYAEDSEGEIHSYAYLIYDENVCYYILGGSDPKYRSDGSQSLVLWEAIKFASKVSRAFDFEGSMVETIEKFFRQFGCTPCVYYEIRKISMLSEVFELVKPKIKKAIGYKT